MIVLKWRVQRIATRDHIGRGAREQIYVIIIIIIRDRENSGTLLLADS